MKIFNSEIIIFWHFSLVSCVFGNELHHLVQDLEDRIQARTTVYYDLIESPLIEDMLRNSRVPNIVIREQVKFELKTHFNSQILAVVFIESHFDDGLMNTLMTTLNGWHGTDMLFIAEDLLSTANWKWLFDWCWSSGFYNVLLVSSQQPTQLLTYTKFPRLQIKSITITKYFEQRNVWHDFHGYPILAGVIHDPPRSIIYNNISSGEEFSGKYYQILKMFAQHHNATLTPVTIGDSSICYSSLEEKLLDICTFGAPLQTNQAYEIAVVPELGLNYFMVPFARPLKKYEYFLLPFDLPSWIAILLSVAFIAVAGCLLRWRHVGVWDFSGSLLMSFSSMLYLGFSLSRGTSRAKILIYAIMTLSGFIITNLYLAKLSSFLTSNVYEKQIETLADLMEKNITVLITEQQAEFVNAFELPEALRKQFKLVDSSTYHSNRLALNPEYAYFCTQETCQFFLQQQILMIRPKLKLITEELGGLLGSVPLVVSWPMKEEFNDFILNVWCMGLNEGIYKRLQEEAIKTGLIQLHKATEVEEDKKPLSMDDFQVALIIFAIGYSAALFVFCTEILIFYFIKLRSRHQ